MCFVADFVVVRRPQFAFGVFLSIKNIYTYNACCRSVKAEGIIRGGERRNVIVHHFSYRSGIGKKWKWRGEREEELIDERENGRD